MTLNVSLCRCREWFEASRNVTPTSSVRRFEDIQEGPEIPDKKDGQDENGEKGEKGENGAEDKKDEEDEKDSSFVTMDGKGASTKVYLNYFEFDFRRSQCCESCLSIRSEVDRF